MPVARRGCIDVLRFSLDALYAHQAALLSVHLEGDMAFAEIDRIDLGTTDATIARWVEGETPLLPIADVYDLVPLEGRPVRLAGSAMSALVSSQRVVPAPSMQPLRSPVRSWNLDLAGQVIWQPNVRTAQVIWPK